MRPVILSGTPGGDSGSASSKWKSPCPRKETDVSHVTQMPITLQEGAARSPHLKGKVPWNEEHKTRQLQVCKQKPFLILPCLCSCSRNSPVWELDGCLSHLHLGSGSSQALTATPSGPGHRKELFNPSLAALHLSASRFLSLQDISEALSHFDNAGSV